MNSYFRNTTLLSFATLLIFLIPLDAQAFQADVDLISGTYTLDRSSSRDPESIIRTSAGSERLSQQQRQDLRSKLSTPTRLEISIVGSNVTLRTAAGGAPAVFEADGQARESQTADGKPVSVRASFVGEVLIIASVGQETDYSITLTPLRDGRQLRVTRRVTTAYLDETIFAESIYTKENFGESTAGRSQPRSRPVLSDGSDRDDPGSRYPSDESSARRDTDDDGYGSDDDQYGGYSDSAPPADRPVTRDYPRTTNRRTTRRNDQQRRTVSRRGRIQNTNFVVPAGTVVAGSLQGLVTTRASQENDRFRIVVESPSQFRGAIIEGYLTGIERTGRMTGRSAVTFNFETIILRDGRRYDFAGVLQNVVDPGGKEIRTNDEGEVTGRSRTKETVKRSGIGAGIGAIIGGILGGGKGALIGASIGAGAGAGSVIPGGRDDLEIEQGSRMTIRSTGPGT